VYDNLTTRVVLVSEWIEGRKLSSFKQENPVGATVGSRV
jgi:predicted unusual protein kinase regulating ubiquinone biosynthesis (AarF/ABC1/UbiB family)